MKFRSKPSECEANQFLHGATAPIGVRTREDGSSYVVTINGNEVIVLPGDWIILENPPGDGTRAYPCQPAVFERRWELVCERCGGDGKAHGSDRPFEWSGPVAYPGPCPVCRGSGLTIAQAEKN